MLCPIPGVQVPGLGFGLTLNDMSPFGVMVSAVKVGGVGGGGVGWWWGVMVVGGGGGCGNSAKKIGAISHVSLKPTVQYHPSRALRCSQPT